MDANQPEAAAVGSPLAGAVRARASALAYGGLISPFASIRGSITLSV